MLHQAVCHKTHVFMAWHLYDRHRTHGVWCDGDDDNVHDVADGVIFITPKKKEWKATRKVLTADGRYGGGGGL